MALFQRAVLKKYVSGINNKELDAAWERFTSHFHDPEVQKNIRNSKEEEYQEGFLDDLFVKVLGYIKNPTPDYNLKVEQKNVTDAKKADELKSQIAQIDQQIDKMVYELYGLSEEEIKVVEGE